MSRRWLALIAFIATAAACGAPSSTDTGTTPTPSGTTNPTSPTPTPPGSHTVTPTPSGSPTPLPTITNVPSYDGWVANVKALGASNSGCLACHQGLNWTYMVSATETDPMTLKVAWFTHLCNYQQPTHEGVLGYSGPTGETYLYYCNLQNPAQMNPNHPGGTVPSNFCAPVTAWLKTGTGAPPPCSGNYDLLNSK